MQELINWQGKTEDMKISYDVGINNPALLPAEIESSNLPAIYCEQNENIRDVVEESWDNSVKKADRIDYAIAVCCGSIAGLVDSFWVGEFSLERANAWGDEKVNKFVKKVAKLNGYKGDDLKGAVKYMEDHFGLAADSNTPDFGGGLQHHLRDFSHHCSIGGLLCSLFTQFTGKVIGTDTAGNLLIVEVKNKAFIGKNFEEKILFGTVNWFFHIVSDMAGSNKTAGKGNGIPGPLLSLMKELSALPCFKDKKINDTELRTWISKLFNGTLLAKRDENGKILEPIKFDLRTEIGVLHEFARQFVPILINECLVRGIYFVRRLYLAFKETEIHSVSDLKNIDASELLPFNNRIISRMVTVSTGTFAAIDTVDAAIRAGIKNGGVNVGFAIDFAVRINFVGIGRFIIACKADSKYIAEDIKDAKAEGATANRRGREYEQTLSDLRCLSLDYNQMRVLYSLERLILSDDITDTDNQSERASKQKWTLMWEKQILDGLPLLEEDKLTFFMSENDIITYIITHNDDETWMHLVAMEAMLFVPYYPLKGDDTDKEFKKLKCKSNYLEDKFVKQQSYITKSDITNLKKSYKSACGMVTGSTKNMVLGGVGTVAVILATGGIAFFAAPSIAVALAGDVGLHGAALVSYSLAAVGGGSLAAGGLGMAGGTAIITGGGALVGMLGGTGVSAATTLNLLNQDSYVLSECCKLLTFSKVVLLKKNEDIDTISYIESQVGGRIADIEDQLKSFKDESEKDKDLKKKIKVAEKSLKYLKRCDKGLKKMIKNPDDAFDDDEEDDVDIDNMLLLNALLDDDMEE